jgi:multidrug efflux pump subunit AcrA (membrane-fusion protein)
MLTSLRRHLWAWALLIAAAVGAQWVVGTYKKPGQMTVIEAQAMDMSALKAPTGSVPVATEAVRAGSASSHVTYSGTVLPLSEAVVYPRVTGWLKDMSVYAGSRVTQGQRLAVLDAPDLDAQVARAEGAARAAEGEVSVAQAEAGRARADQAAARAEIAAAQGDTASMGAEVLAASRGVSQMAAEVRQAQAAARQSQSGIVEAEAALEGARRDLSTTQADLNYWRAEAGRSEKLVRVGAVSLDEYQMERSKYLSARSASQAAEARVKQAQAAVRSAQDMAAERQAMVDTAGQKLEQAKAMVASAQAKARNRGSMVAAARARAEAADAAFRAARSQIDKQAAMAGSARGETQYARLFSGYRELRSPLSGVVAERLVAPGTLVNPSMAILRVVDQSRLRVQANISETDMTDLRVGGEATLRTLHGNHTLKARITSIFPEANHAAHTSLVEVLVPGGSGLELNEHVSMDLRTNSDTHVITVPTRAIQRFSGEGKPSLWLAVGGAPEPGAKQDYTCTMHPQVHQSHPGPCPICGMPLVPSKRVGPKSARLVTVTLGRDNEDRTEVLSGLKDGDEVIVDGYQSLREGDTVTPVPWGPKGPAQAVAPGGGGGRLSAANGWTSTQSVGDLSVSLAVSGATAGKPVEAAVTLADASGKPVTDAEVTATTSMPGMDMGSTPKLDLRPEGPGKLRGSASFSGGPWQIQLHVRRAGADIGATAFTFDVAS